ncbi:reverse transcriptase domain-containing protein [Tanacetum coccineum]
MIDGTAGKLLCMDHWGTYIVEEDFKSIAESGLNAMRIPVGCWTASDPTPPKPFVGGSLQYLDNVCCNPSLYVVELIDCVNMDMIRLRWGSKSYGGEYWIAKSYILQNYNLMDDEPMWAADPVVASTPGSTIIIPETTNEFAIKGNGNSDIDKIMARMDAMIMKLDAQYKEFQTRSKQWIPDCNDDDTPMSREEEAKFMQTFRHTHFYNDYRNRDSNRDN